MIYTSIRDIELIENHFVNRFNPEYETRDLLKIIKYVTRIKRFLNDAYHHNMSWYDKWVLKKNIKKLNKIITHYGYEVTVN